MLKIKHREGELTLSKQPTKIMTKAQARMEASRCLHCYWASCMHGCLAGIDVPKFIRRIATEDYRGAAEVIRKDNPLGMICAQICPQEQLCVSGKQCCHKLIGTGIQVNRLRTFVLEYTKLPSTKPEAARNKKVAIIGGDSSGLTAAAYLYELGYSVTIYEKSKELGSIPQSQIPAFQLDRKAAQAEISNLLGEAIRVRTGTNMDKPLAGDILKNYDAVYISALGQDSGNKLAEAFNLAVDTKDRVTVNSQLQIENPCIFAGGDFINGDSTVVQAVADGKKGAYSIHAYLQSKD